MTRTLILAALAATALMATAARAEPDAAQRLAVKLEARHIQPLANGGENVSPAKQARPGELLEYRAHYRNTGPAPARQMTAVLPLPAGTAFVAGSAHPIDAQASTDGRHFEALPLMRWVVLPDGKREKRPVPVDEYRALRWQLGDLPPGGEAVTVSARVRLAGVKGEAQ